MTESEDHVEQFLAAASPFVDKYKTQPVGFQLFFNALKNALLKRNKPVQHALLSQTVKRFGGGTQAPALAPAIASMNNAYSQGRA